MTPVGKNSRRDSGQSEESAPINLGNAGQIGVALEVLNEIQPISNQVDI